MKRPRKRFEFVFRGTYDDFSKWLYINLPKNPEWYIQITILLPGITTFSRHISIHTGKSIIWFFMRFKRLIIDKNENSLKKNSWSSGKN